MSFLVDEKLETEVSTGRTQNLVLEPDPKDDPSYPSNGEQSLLGGVYKKITVRFLHRTMGM